jgi:hypothetical protein
MPLDEAAQIAGTLQTWAIYFSLDIYESTSIIIIWIPS